MQEIGRHAGGFERFGRGLARESYVFGGNENNPGIKRPRGGRHLLTPKLCEAHILNALVRILNRDAQQPGRIAVLERLQQHGADYG